MAVLDPQRARERESLASRVSRVPWWATVLVIFAASRVITTILLRLTAFLQNRVSPWDGPVPGIGAYSNQWDAGWYERASIGYPTVLPTDATGHVVGNAWAFLPAYPMVVRAVGSVTGLTFDHAGILVSLLFALGAALVFYRVLAPSLGHSRALFAVLLFCVAPLSPVLQLTYAESMQLFFLMCCLYLLMRRRYWMLLPFILAMALTRPGAQAFALAMALHIGHRWYTRARDPFPPMERRASIAALALSSVAGFIWPAVAAIATGDPSAYAKTELSWRYVYVGYEPLIPFSAWPAALSHVMPYGLGLLVLAAGIVGLVFLFRMRAVRRLPLDLRFWSASWIVYLLAVFYPQGSTWRLLMPTFPLLGSLALPRSRAYRIALVAGSIALQAAWLALYWAWQPHGIGQVP